MSYKAQYSVLDRPEILQFVFYPRKDWSETPLGATDHLVPVEGDLSVSCRFYSAGGAFASILFFHGNGEVASDYDWIAPIYNSAGINLFVADYRGYGLSGGSPTFSSMVADSHPIFHYFCALARTSRENSPIFVMGRSLGSHSALELAAEYSREIRGLIMESSFANPGRLLRRFSVLAAVDELENLERASLERIRSIKLPVLIIHGEYDSLIPVSHAIDFYEEVGSKDKELVIIPGADHNDIMLIGREQYFSALREFVFRHAGQGATNQ